MDITIGVAFVAGLLSFFTPCVLPLVPVYLASLVGPEIFESKPSRWHFNIFVHSLSFVAGFTIVFTLLGAGIGLTGFALNAHLALIRNISGALLIIFGLFMLASLKIPWLNYEKRLKPTQGMTAGYLRSLVTGSIFSVAWTPCVGPILASIMTLAFNSETVFKGAYLLAIYSLGLGLPFLILGIAFDSISPLLKKVQRYSLVIYLISSILLIAVGILILTDKLTLLQGAR
jgi:cytochrome c-type biogenesis protein